MAYYSSGTSATIFIVDGVASNVEVVFNNEIAIEEEKEKIESEIEENIYPIIIYEIMIGVKLIKRIINQLPRAPPIRVISGIDVTGYAGVIL